MADLGKIFYKLIVNFIKKFVHKKITEKKEKKGGKNEKKKFSYESSDCNLYIYYILW